MSDIRSVEEEALLAEGASVDSQNILDDVPSFAGSAREIHAALTPAQAPRLLLPSGLLAILVAEAVKLAEMKAKHDAQKAKAAGFRADRESAWANEKTSAIVERDLTYDGLRNALGEGVVAELSAIVGTAETPEKLATGLESLAGLIDDRIKKGDEEDVHALAQWGVGAERAAHLRQKAKTVREAGAITATPERRVSQRALDLQDGRVLFVIGKVLRAFRAANRADASILVPSLNKIAWKFEIRGRSPKQPAAPAPAGGVTPG